MIATAGVVIFLIVSAWYVFPAIRRTSTWADMSMLVLAAVVCVSCFYFVSVAIATVLDETWQVWGSLLVAGLGWWVTSRIGLPPSANVFSFMTDASPLRYT